MNKVSRPLLFSLLTVLLVVLAAAIASHHFADGSGPHLVMFDQDLSESMVGWIIAIPIMMIVVAIVIAVLAGAALMTVLAVTFAAVLVVLAVILAFVPFALFFAIPVLAIYGFVKLIQRDRKSMAAAA